MQGEEEKEGKRAEYMITSTVPHAAMHCFIEEEFGSDLEEEDDDTCLQQE